MTANRREIRKAGRHPLAQAYDFSRTDRIGKDPLQAIRLLHENFARNTSSSLSAYLRAYVAVNLTSVEQLSFAELAQSLPQPTSLMSLGMKPYDGNAVLELNPTLVFPILEMMLGGTGKASAGIKREMTDIERDILDGVLRILLRDLRSAWLAVAEIEFSLQGHETEPKQSLIMAANEAVVAIGLEMRIGDISGMMHIVIPSILVKMLRQRFDQHGGTRRTQATDQDQARVLRLLDLAQIHLEARLQGPTLGMALLLDLKEGDILAFDYPAGRPVDLLVNGKLKYKGEIVGLGRKRALQIGQIVSNSSRPEPTAPIVSTASVVPTVISD
jgi:flagellar motor switch protein FliM